MTLGDVLKPALRARAETLAAEIRERFGPEGVEVVEDGGTVKIKVSNPEALAAEFGDEPWMYDVGKHGSR